jgi:hypothetical protein
MFMDNLYFHTIDVHVLVCINDSMALHTSDSSEKKKKIQVTRSITLIQLALNFLHFNLTFYNLSTL